MNAEESDGWIEYATNKGDKLLTYDAEIHTKQQAIDKGYRNVDTVSESLSYNGTSGFESYNLNEDGLVSDNLSGAITDVGFTPMRTGDGYLISQSRDKEGWTKLGMSLMFTRTGKLGVKATERAIGKGLDTGTKTLINGINITMEKTIGVETERTLNKKQDDLYNN